MSYRVVAAAALALFGFGTAAQAEDCKLVRAASIDLTRTESGMETMKVGIEGNEFSFVLNTGSAVSFISASAVRKLRYTAKALNSVYIQGAQLTQGAVIPKIELGSLVGDEQSFYISPDEDVSGHVDGEIGFDKLEAYDIELDLAHGKLNLFQPDHCKGRVVYWTDSAATIPLEIQPNGQINVPMELDGKPVNVMLDTTLATSSMAFAASHRLFGFHRSDLQLTAAASAAPPFVDLYRATFRSLNVGGLSITSPEMTINDFGDAEAICDGKFHVPTHSRHYPVPYRCFGGGDLRLGLKQLRALRLFIAFSEKMLYITPADAH